MNSINATQLWQDELRTILVFGIYQVLFDQKLKLENSVDWNNIVKNLIEEEALELGFEPDINFLNSQLENFQVNKVELVAIIEPHLTKKFSTLYDILKAILLSFAMEYTALKQDSLELDDKIKAQLFTQYLTLAQEYTMLANTRMVHGILASVMNIKGKIKEV